jgi:hypothetical protein
MSSMRTIELETKPTPSTVISKAAVPSATVLGVIALYLAVNWVCLRVLGVAHGDLGLQHLAREL